MTHLSSVPLEIWCRLKAGRCCCQCWIAAKRRDLGGLDLRSCIGLSEPWNIDTAGCCWSRHRLVVVVALNDVRTLRNFGGDGRFILWKNLRNRWNVGKTSRMVSWEVRRLCVLIDCGSVQWLWPRREYRSRWFAVNCRGEELN
jgi:hypothetical protein